MDYENISGSSGGGNWLNTLGSFASSAAGVYKSLRDDERLDEKRIIEPAPEKQISKNTLLLIGGAIVAVLAFVFILKK